MGANPWDMNIYVCMLLRICRNREREIEIEPLCLPDQCGASARLVVHVAAHPHHLSVLGVALCQFRSSTCSPTQSPWLTRLRSLSELHKDTSKYIHI